jgi:hypothetical protein
MSMQPKGPGRRSGGDGVGSAGKGLCLKRRFPCWAPGGRIKGMRILVIGGTWFLGKTIAEGALARGWAVATFNRGRSGCDVPGVEPIHGDRTVCSLLSTVPGTR